MALCKWDFVIDKYVWEEKFPGGRDSIPAQLCIVSLCQIYYWYWKGTIIFKWVLQLNICNDVAVFYLVPDYIAVTQFPTLSTNFTDLRNPSAQQDTTFSWWGFSVFQWSWELCQWVQAPGRVTLARQVLAEEPAEACPTMIGWRRSSFQTWLNEST